MDWKTLIIILIIITIAVVWYIISRPLDIENNGLEENKKEEGENKEAEEFGMAEARAIAEKSDCVKDGNLTDEIFYNENSQTWWIGLDVEKPGCNPACVVSEESKTAEINWRCTGLILPDNRTKEEIVKELFAQKYNKKASDIIISIEKQDDSHCRGLVQFSAGQEGGIFLAAKVDNEWKLIFDGNGAISCEVVKYGFPINMIPDCVF